MATGDTIPGAVTVYKQKASGSEPKVAGQFNQSDVDTFEDSAGEKLYLNTGQVSAKTSPLQARDEAYPGAVFGPGEVIRIVHESNDDSSGNSIDVGADEFNIGTVEVDLNASKGSNDRVFPSALTVADNEVTSNPSESEDGAVIYEVTVPDRTRIHLAGAFEVAAVEV